MEIMRLLQFLNFAAACSFLLHGAGLADANPRRQGSKAKAIKPKPKAQTTFGGRNDTQAGGEACFQRDAVTWRVRISPIANKRTDEIIRYYGYPAEVHEVTTRDGFILTLQRIPYGKRDKDLK